MRHFCKTKYLVVVNNMLTDEQKSCIAATPFGWLMFLNRNVKISRTLLSQLSFRWVESRGAFKIRSVFVPFSLLDVCLGLGLRVVGEKVDLEDNYVGSHCRALFSTKHVYLNMV